MIRFTDETTILKNYYKAATETVEIPYKDWEAIKSGVLHKFSEQNPDYVGIWREETPGVDSENDIMVFTSRESIDVLELVKYEYEDSLDALIKDLSINFGKDNARNYVEYILNQLD